MWIQLKITEVTHLQIQWNDHKEVQSRICRFHRNIVDSFLREEDCCFTLSGIPLTSPIKWSFSIIYELDNDAIKKTLSILAHLKDICVLGSPFSFARISGRNFASGRTGNFRSPRFMHCCLLLAVGANYGVFPASAYIIEQSVDTNLEVRDHREKPDDRR